MYCGNCGVETSSKFCRTCGAENEDVEPGIQAMGADRAKQDITPKKPLATVLIVSGVLVSLIGLVILNGGSALDTKITKTVTAIEVAKDMYQRSEGNFLEWKTNLETCEAGSLAKILGCSYQEQQMNDYGNEMALHLTKLEEFVDYQKDLLLEQTQSYTNGSLLLALGVIIITFGLFTRKSRRKDLQVFEGERTGEN